MLSVSYLNIITFNIMKVMLVGSRKATVVGRPYVEGAQVYYSYMHLCFFSSSLSSSSYSSFCSVFK